MRHLRATASEPGSWPVLALLPERSGAGAPLRGKTCRPTEPGAQLVDRIRRVPRRAGGCDPRGLHAAPACHRPRPDRHRDPDRGPRSDPQPRSRRWGAGPRAGSLLRRVWAGPRARHHSPGRSRAPIPPPRRDYRSIPSPRSSIRYPPTAITGAGTPIRNQTPIRPHPRNQPRRHQRPRPLPDHPPDRRHRLDPRRHRRRRSLPRHPSPTRATGHVTCTPCRGSSGSPGRIGTSSQTPPAV